ncbi:MAG: hypothetical protein E7041_08115 [Lentisphaerae bacterium]|nr:hypothetical protein [Lentisphaerota bacterium]MBQ9803630.1 hypothetical protein [Lentisphaeria bacterium]
MNLKAIINKVLSSEPLNALEKAELENLDCDLATGKSLTDLQQKYDSLHQELTALRHHRRMEQLCFQLHCTDPDYLEFCARKNNIDVNDDDAMRTFAAELAQSSPGCFQAHIVPGSNAGNTPVSLPDAGGSRNVSCDRISSIVESINDAPEAH